MCDCYWARCEQCSEHLPLHIADFCLPRRDVAVFCARHLPTRDVVIYELVAEAWRPGGAEHDLFQLDPPKGWRMGVRYRRRPPSGYGLQAAEPNIGAPYLAMHLTGRGGRRFFTHGSPRVHGSERGAIRYALETVRRRREACAGEAEIRTWFDEEARLWAALDAQARLRVASPRLIEQISLLNELRGSGRLTAVILIGSLNNRDFVPGLSDIDLWVLGRGLKPGLKIVTVTAGGEALEVNLVCRNMRFLHRMLRDRNPVDLVALRYGTVLCGTQAVQGLRRRVAGYRASGKTRDAWMKSSARWLGRALEQYVSPHCAHCFFGALFHAARDLLRAHLVGAGEDLTEGWETEAAVARRWPDLAERYGRIRHARAHWESFDFPLFKDRTRLEGDLGELVRALWEIAQSAYRGAGWQLPRLESLLQAVARRRGEGGMCWSIQPHEGRLTVVFQTAGGKLKSLKRTLRPARGGRSAARESDVPDTPSGPRGRPRR